MSISDDTLRLTRKLRRDLNKITDRHARDLVASWARGWDEVASELDQALQALAEQADGTISRTALRRSERLTRALAVIGRRLQQLAGDAGVLISGDLAEVVETAGRAQERIIASQLPRQATDLIVSWDRVDTNAIDAIIRRATGRIHAATRPLSADAVAGMKRELTRGLSVGANPRETARRMLARLEGQFNGGLTRALTISRTESLDALRAGSQLAQQANSQVLTGWVWTAALSGDTCPACWGMHGTVHALTEPGPLGHPNCRCARTPKTKTWADLGFDVEEPADAMPDAAAAFRALPVATQRSVLGPGRYEAWQAGSLPMSHWATRRSNRGWRDSYVPVRAPAA